VTKAEMGRMQFGKQIAHSLLESIRSLGSFDEGLMISTAACQSTFNFSGE
jgi:hypothetical protein